MPASVQQYPHPSQHYQPDSSALQFHSGPAYGLLPDQEFIPINTETPSLDRAPVFSSPEDAPITSSLFSSSFGMFGPVVGYGGTTRPDNDLMAGLHADSQPVETTKGRS